MKKIYDTKWFLNRIKESHPDDYKDYILKSKYINNTTKVKLLHIPCGKTITISPASFMRGRGCQYCGIKRRVDSRKLTVKEAQTRIPSYIKIVGNYVGMLYPCKLHCEICGWTYYSRIHDISRSKCCPYCSGRKKESTKVFSREVSDMTEGEYALVGEYTNANEYVSIKHVKCGTIYKVTPHNFKRGRRCPRCKKSHGEINIEKILHAMDIKYESPKTFPDLYFKEKLHYDFYIKSLNLLIEYQGEQHYKPVKHFGGENKFKRQITNDILKKKYALENGYEFLEIPYKISGYKEIKSYIEKFIKNM